MYKKRGSEDISEERHEHSGSDGLVYMKKKLRD